MADFEIDGDSILGTHVTTLNTISAWTYMLEKSVSDKYIYLFIRMYAVPTSQIITNIKWEAFRPSTTIDIIFHY
jgi:hypothetical protein